MIRNEIQLPFYLKTTILFVGLIALMAILYIGQTIIVPLIFSLVIAILLQPVVLLMVRFKVNRIIAITITMLLTFVIIIGVGTLLISQIAQFKESWPILIDRSIEIINKTIINGSDYFSLNPTIIHEWFAKTANEIIAYGTNSIGQTLLSLGNDLIILFLIPFYVFILLYYQPLLIEVIHKLFAKHNHTQLNEVITQTKQVIQQYLVGLIIEAILVAILNSLGLLWIGIEYAILLGILGALLNVIPYIGGIVAIALPLMVALATQQSPWPAIWVVLLYSVVQTIDNNFIVPVIVAAKVKINALFSVIVVLVGNALWGVSGMFLSIPLLAIVKVIFDHIDNLKPWGYLLGDTMPPVITFKHRWLPKKN